MISIRQYREADWPSLCRIHDAARPDELKGSCDARAFIPLADEPDAEELRVSHVLVAQIEEEIVGFAGVDDDYLGWLYVHPNYYRKGIGRKLLQKSLQLASGEPWTIVLAENRSAIGLYQSEGFTEETRFESENAGYPCTCLRMIQKS